MEELYDDLDNYNNVNAVQELRTENMQLKVKLEEHATAMEKLQKDYDALEMEFKKLESSYSSLLKTARSEIERKTSMITQLNKEKDIMVLDALQNGRKFRRNFNKVAPNKNQNVKKLTEDTSKAKKTDPKQKRDNSSGAQAKDILPSAKEDSKTHHVDKAETADQEATKNSSKDRKSSVRENSKSDNKDSDKKRKLLSSNTDSKVHVDKVENVGIKKDSSKNKKTNVGEDIKGDIKDTSDKKPKDVVPSSNTDRSHNVDNVESMHTKLSSYKIKKKSNVKDDIKTDVSYKHAGSIRDRRKSTPAVVSMTYDKFSSDEECEQGYHSKYSRNDIPPMDKLERRYLDRFPNDRDSNKTSETSSIEERGSNFYESSSRDTYRSRRDRHYPPSYVSLPHKDKEQYSEKYRKHFSPDREHRKRPYREYNQDNYHRQDQARYRQLDNSPCESSYRHQGRNVETRNNYRFIRRDYGNYRHLDKHRYTSDYDEPHNKRQKMESHNSNLEKYNMDDHRYHPGKENFNKQPSPEFSPHEYDNLRASCQSPDDEQMNEPHSYPIKEIMTEQHTTTTPLADPRVTSECYIIKNENGIDKISTYVGRNVDIIPVDKSKWTGSEPVGIPDALRRRPSQCSEEFVKNIYKDLDDPIDNDSVELGEIPDYEEELLEYGRTKKTNDQPESKTQEVKDLQNIQSTENILTPFKCAEISHEISISKHRISQAEKNKILKSNTDVSGTDKKEPKLATNVDGKRTPESSKKSPRKQKENEKHDSILSTKIGKNEEVMGKSKNDSRITLADMAIVADDLELSDENDDIVDTNSQTTIKVGKHNYKVQSSIKEVIGKKATDSEYEDRNQPIHETIEKAVGKFQSNKICNEEKIQDSDNAKKPKGKKKRSKSKEISKDLIESAHEEEKRMKCKNDELKPKEIKAKFSDLFGDSSSLMTPEDLGIPSYLPITEDAQDAVDLEIKKMIDDPPLFTDKKDVSIGRNPESQEINKQYEGNAENILQPPDIENKEIAEDTKKKRTSKKKGDIIECNAISPTNIVDVNLIAGTNSTDETNFVTTVIISKGEQPSLSSDNKEVALVEKPAVVLLPPKNNFDQNPALTEIKALATSTPHKEFSVVTSVNVDSRTTDLVMNSNDSNVMGSRNAVQNAEQSDSNTVDAPDVRIFVKRRRKILKRPPMT